MSDNEHTLSPLDNLPKQLHWVVKCYYELNRNVCPQVPRPIVYPEWGQGMLNSFLVRRSDYWIADWAQWKGVELRGSALELMRARNEVWRMLQVLCADLGIPVPTQPEDGGPPWPAADASGHAAEPSPSPNATDQQPSPPSESAPPLTPRQAKKRLEDELLVGKVNRLRGDHATWSSEKIAEELCTTPKTLNRAYDRLYGPGHRPWS